MRKDKHTCSGRQHTHSPPPGWSSSRGWAGTAWWRARRALWTTWSRRNTGRGRQTSSCCRHRQRARRLLRAAPRLHPLVPPPPPAAPRFSLHPSHLRYPWCRQPPWLGAQAPLWWAAHAKEAARNQTPPNKLNQLVGSQESADDLPAPSITAGVEEWQV